MRPRATGGRQGLAKGLGHARGLDGDLSTLARGQGFETA